ncbi:TetR family transcriptional regulator [Simiduia sp. 21SJ11W-1]|uniref:TetR/AcrR family transcriptional regulator n=1 Tax=Simiduia sp. 21SJ11W-1 TaxID=2909669 RepID=UPI00209CBBB9|nr:TetR family transcriptional regulator [Simiduia sp. 21SJ11W-1]UTA49252.1 TetR family transcriptional regulator [Simiduia sp. 21SJ11W-1]
MGTAVKSRRAKGEQTRREILEATLRLIVRNGHNAVTHRAVAAEAGVNLSLTTYYFKDLKELISESFDHYRNKVEQEVDSTWEKLLQFLEQSPIETLDEKRKLLDHLTQFATDYVRDMIRHRPSGLVLEMTFFFDLHLEPEMRAGAVELRKRFQRGFEVFCERLGSPAPEVDAALLLGALQRLEYVGLATNEVDEQAMHAQFKRLLSTIMSVPFDAEPN